MPPCEKPVFDGLQTSKTKTSLCSPISTFVIRLLENIISRLAGSKITNFWLVSVAEWAGLSLTLSETPKTGFLTSQPI